jgi:hypothetical protein
MMFIDFGLAILPMFAKQRCKCLSDMVFLQQAA